MLATGILMSEPWIYGMCLVGTSQWHIPKMRNQRISDIMNFELLSKITNRHLGGCDILTTVISAAMNNGVYMSFSINMFIFFG